MPPPFRGKRGFSRNNNNNGKRPRLDQGDFDLEKARHEVFMLGIKGFSHKDKQEAKKELAIRLGAIPKKPRGKNIKQHIEEVRERKRKQEEEREERAKTGDFEDKPGKRSKNDNNKRKKGLNEVREMDYQIGKFKNGVQYLSKEDIERLKRKRR